MGQKNPMPSTHQYTCQRDAGACPWWLIHLPVHQSALGLAELVAQLVDTLSNQEPARQCKKLHTMLRTIAFNSGLQSQLVAF